MGSGEAQHGDLTPPPPENGGEEVTEGCGGVPQAFEEVGAGVVQGGEGLGVAEAAGVSGKGKQV